MKLKRFITLLLAAVMTVCILPTSAFASSKTAAKAAEPTLRRPVSPEQPKWIVHIDTWNYADPAKIIDLIPEDILPYVVFNISMSINYDHDTHTWGMVNDGYELAKSWLRTCAEKNVWALIQPASGGQCHFPDYYEPNTDLENTVFGEFFRDYPNFLGFNYCEQFWGFDQKDFPTTYKQRYQHFANLLKLTHKYGGYLVVSWCGNQWGQALNPIAMLKQVPEFEKACLDYTENYILCEKHTQVGYLQDVESQVLGAYLSGYVGEAGLRYDSTGWTDENGDHDKNYTLATGIAPHIERLMQCGFTVIDGPELIWNDDFNENWKKTDSQGYTYRSWKMTDQFQNISIDIFRKLIDGTIRIPSREEVIERTKVVIIQDNKYASDDGKYCSPVTLFEGLYRMDDDGNLRDNHNFFKKTGRYPTIPTVYNLADDAAKSFEYQVNYTKYASRWGRVEKKVAEFNKIFEKEYAGNMYVRSSENAWTVYNPFKSGKAATARVNFRYNTADYFEMSLSRYSGGVVTEYSDSLKFYLNNYDNKLSKSTDLKTDLIKIYGCTEEPKVTYKDRGVSQAKSKVTTLWKDGVLTVKVQHNGPVDITVTNAKGKNTDRLTKYKKSGITAPARPPIYAGPYQYEAEHFDIKNCNKYVENGCRTGVDNFQGQGYLIFGKKSGASVRDTVTALKSGEYTFTLRYAAAKADISGLDLYVNGQKVKTLSLKKTGSTSKWGTVSAKIKLNKGENKIELKADSTLADELYIDNFVIS